MSELLQKGIAAFEALDYCQALRCFELEDSAQPNQPQVHLWLASTYQQLGRLEEAEVIFQELIDKNEAPLAQMASRGLAQCRAARNSTTMLGAPSSFEQNKSNTITPLSEAITRPLSVGDIISTGIKNYREHFSEYLKLAATAYLFLLLNIIAITMVGVIIGGIIFSITGSVYNFSQFSLNNLSSLVGGTLLVFLVCILTALIAVFIGLAPFIVRQGTILSLAFQDLIGKPKTIGEILPQLKVRSWQIVGAVCLESGVIFLPLLGFSIIALILILAAGRSFTTGSIVFLLFFVTTGVTLNLLIKTRLVIAVIVVENLRPILALKRSFSLIKGNFWRVAGVSILTFLLGIASALLQSAIQFFIQLILSTFIYDIAVLSLLQTILSGIISLALTCLLLPIVTTIAAALYYDLRARKEGLDLLSQLGDL